MSEYVKTENTENTEKKRCFGNKPGQEFYALYHDNEWGIPKHDDRELFELLILEGAQAGLSWEIILKKRQAYKIAFKNFQPLQVADMKDCELEKLLHNKNIVRNRRKIYATRQNANVFCNIQQKYKTFDRYIWQFVNGKPIINHWESLKQVPVNTQKSQIISKELKNKGMNFVGPTIIYAYMQAIGIVNDHPKDCWKYGK